MMKVAVIGGTGKVGAVLVEEALRRGHPVTALSRHPDAVVPRPGLEARQGDVAEPAALAAALKGHDVVISSVRFVDFDHDQMLTALRDSGVPRYLCVGGAGSLRHPAGGLVYDHGTMPEPVLRNSRLGGVWLERLRQSGLGWTMLCPGIRFVDGRRTGQFRLGLDDAIMAEDGTSSISWQDFAVALIDEMEVPRHSGRRFAVGY